MTQEDLASPHHLEIAKSYLNAAKRLAAQEDAELMHDPSYFLLAHGAELTLKAASSAYGLSSSQIFNCGHDLSLTFARLKEIEPSVARLTCKHVSNKWREYLRAARKRTVDELADYGVTEPDSLKEFGIPTNADIGKDAPRFLDALQWLGDRHKSAGGVFRYLKLGHDQEPFIKVFNLTESTIPKSIEWGCWFLLSKLENSHRK